MRSLTRLLPILAAPLFLLATEISTPAFVSTIGTQAEPMQAGRFEATWKSLQQYEVPEWFRDAKFGIWAHWGPQCAPEQGDWYGRFMYVEGHRQYLWHLAHYGHPSTFGFKDVIRSWKAENWDPQKLVALYKRAGAQYFFALANHHDNFDLFDSKYQPWNSLRLGPGKDIIGRWAKAARENGLRFGVSVHAAHAWTWYEFSQSADKKGALAGKPYDGKLTAADGKGQWWEGLDPQQLYAQSHPRSAKGETPEGIHSQWNWDNGASIPEPAWCEQFYNRTVDLINKYQPDLIYFDDTVLPLYPVSDAGLRIAAHFYNSNEKWHGAKSTGVLFGKILSEDQRRCITWDVERGAPNRIEPLPWQTCTCIGDWHYRRSIYEDHRYKGVATVIRTLADVVSKNGNLLLSIPVRGDGTIDADEIAIVEGIARWMDVNRECIFGTRPWKVYGEGPSVANAAPLSAQGFNESKGKPYTWQDLRFTQKGHYVYAIGLGWPEGPIEIKSFSQAMGFADGKVSRITLLGSEEAINWRQTELALEISPPSKKPAEAHTIVFKIELR